MGPADVQRYKRLLLEKQHELTAAKAQAAAPLLGTLKEISLTKPTLMPKRSFRSGCAGLTVASSVRLKRRWFGSKEVVLVCAKLVGSPSPELAWRQCPGRTFAENIRSVNRLEPLNRKA